MKIRVTMIAGLAIVLLAAGCTRDEGNERWVTTSDTTVAIDWDKIGEAYKQAEGPKDFEKRVNEIYEGEEIISVSVQDKDDKTQVVTGFFDRNGNGTVEKAEQIFVITRDVVGDKKAQYQVSGYGPYAGYRSPMWDIASGMLLGSMMASMFSPAYAPAYRTPYVTSSSRVTNLRSQRATYRAQNPNRFGARSKASGSGRTYGNKGSSWGSGNRSSGSSSGRSSGSSSSRSRSSGGGSFGIHKRRQRRRHLTD